MFALLTLMVDIFVCRNSSTFSEITKIFLSFLFFYLIDRFLILYLFLEDSFTFARRTIDVRSVQRQIKEISSRITAISFNLDLLTNPRAVRHQR